MAPLTASAPPTKKAVRARGMRMLHKMEAAAGSTEEGSAVPDILSAIMVMAEESGIPTLPIPMQSASTRMDRSADTVIRTDML